MVRLYHMTLISFHFFSIWYSQIMQSLSYVMNIIVDMQLKMLLYAMDIVLVTVRVYVSMGYEFFWLHHMLPLVIIEVFSSNNSA